MRCKSHHELRLKMMLMGMRKAIEEMIKESVIEAFKGLVRDGLLSSEEAASRAGVTASGLDNMDVF